MIPDVLYHTLYVIGGIIAGGLAIAGVFLLVLLNEMKEDRYKSPPPDIAKGLDADPRDQMVQDPPVPPFSGQAEVDISLFKDRRN